MSGTKIIIISIILAGLAGCQTMQVPVQYNFRLKEVRNNPFGCWCEVIHDSTALASGIPKTAGELLAFQNDSLFLLIRDGEVKSIGKNSILTASLYIHKDQTPTYALLSSLFIIPNLVGAIVNPEGYAMELLALGIPVSVTGITVSSLEGFLQRNLYIYPKKHALHEFRPFARYPAGMPLNIDYHSLCLKK